MALDVLTESGTNEMELLVFSVGKTSYGINVAKVRELVLTRRVTAVPFSPAYVDGTFILRQEVMTQVNLASYLQVVSRKDAQGQLIIVELNGVRCGVMVDSVDRIHRLNWDMINPPSDLLQNTGAPITATARVARQVVLILDFETILQDIICTNDSPNRPVDASAGSLIAATRILVVDDSVLARKKVETMLVEAGCPDVTVCGDGVEALEQIETARAQGALFDIVLSDIEMPRMDGLRLTKMIKDDPELCQMPVLLFSSLISEDNLNKGQAVGADAQVTKFQADELIKEIEKHLTQRNVA